MNKRWVSLLLANRAAVVVTSNHTGHDLVVQGNNPGGATISANVAGHDATCSANKPQAGGGNVAGSSRSCPN